MDTLRSNIERREKLLSNPGYVNKAPENLVAMERDKLEIEKNKLKELEEKYKKLRFFCRKNNVNI